MRAVIDSSVLFSAFLYPERRTGRVLTDAMARRYTFCTTRLLLHELLHAMKRSRTVRKFGHDDETIMTFVDLLSRLGEVVEDVPDIPRVPRDPFDDHVLAAVRTRGPMSLFQATKTCWC